MAEENYKERYGMQIPEHVSDVSVELWCYLHNHPEKKGGLGAAGHLKRAIRMLFPDTTRNGTALYTWHEWVDRRVEDWCANRFLTTWGPAASAKAQPHDATVYTPLGPVTIGSLKAGDRVSSLDGNTAAVLRVTERGMRDCYRVTFNDGTSTECAGDHLWEVNNASYKWPRSKVVETEWLATHCRRESGRADYAIPLCDAVYFQKRSILMDPYVFGALIGDGCFGGSKGNGSLKFTSADADIVAELAYRLKKDYEVVEEKKYGFRIVKRTRVNGSANDYIRALKTYGLWANRSEHKFIPDDYLYNSRRIRRDVLAGLMDTDGTVSKTGAISFTSVSKRLADNVAFLARSLGGIARINIRPAGYRDKCGTYIPCLPCYTVHMQLPDETSIFKCVRKINRIKKRRITSRCIVGVEYIGQKEMRCITIDDPRGLYLTNDFIATHNSTDFGVIALVDWYADPSNTTTIICSTTLKMLHRRIFGEVVKFHQMYKGDTPGTYIKSKTCIVLNPDMAEADNEKAGIFGFAVQQGDVRKARDDIIGQHNRRIRLLIDEAQHSSLEVAFDARSNLMKGCQDFKLVAFGNPDSRLDPLGRYSEPENGWDSINPDMESWKTKRGKCSYYDGLKSPAMKDPQKYHFLIGEQDFKDTEQDQGYDSPDYWQFCRGFVRPEGSAMQIISESFAIKYQMLAKPEWLSGYEVGAGFDPSYSSGGDHRVIVPFQIGMSTAGVTTISFLEPYQINVEVSKLGDKTFARQMAEKAIEHCRSLGIQKRNFGMDTTGAQTILADFIDEVWEEEGKIYRCEFGGKASDLRASERNRDTAYDVYANRVTELWFNVVSFARCDQVRNLPLIALKQFTMRNIVSGADMRMRTVKRQIEPKPVMKARTGGKSPDEADACCVGIDLARMRMNLRFEVKQEAASKIGDSDPFAVEHDLDGREDLYMTSDV